MISHKSMIFEKENFALALRLRPASVSPSREHLRKLELIRVKLTISNSYVYARCWFWCCCAQPASSASAKSSGKLKDDSSCSAWSTPRKRSCNQIAPRDSRAPSIDSRSLAHALTIRVWLHEHWQQQVLPFQHLWVAFFTSSTAIDCSLCQISLSAPRMTIQLASASSCAHSISDFFAWNLSILS